MPRTVTVPMPLNVDEESQNLYAPFCRYTIEQQKVLLLKDVFVTSSGLALDNTGLIKECHHDYPKQYGTLLRDAMKHIRSARDNEELVIRGEDDKTYLLIHHPWYNYYHWICESIFRLWMVHKSLDQLTLILPETYKHADFIMGSIEPFGITNIYYVPSGKSIFVRNLCLPQIKPICDSYNALQVRQVRRFYRNYVKEREKNVSIDSERLYVSRKYAGRRSVINEEEILGILKKFDFTIFYPEKHNFLDQVVIFAEVKFLVGEHGSGLTNMLFIKKGASLLELHKNNTNELDHPSCLFWYLAEGLGVNYYHQSCKTSGKEDYFKGDYIVDPVLLETNLAQMLRAGSG